MKNKSIVIAVVLLSTSILLGVDEQPSQLPNTDYELRTIKAIEEPATEAVPEIATPEAEAQQEQSQAICTSGTCSSRSTSAAKSSSTRRGLFSRLRWRR